MSYQTILLHVNSHHLSNRLVEFAAGVTAQYGAHLVASVPTGFPTLAIGDAYGGSAQYLQLMQQELEDAARSAGEFVTEQCKRLGVESFEVRCTTNSSGDATAMNARYADLVILEQPDRTQSGQTPERTGFVSDMLLNVTRPVLISPVSGSPQSAFERVMIGWNASNEAARAVAGAIPVLKRAKAVQVVVVNADKTRGAHGAEPGADLAAYLVRHGIHTEVCNLEVVSDPAYALFQQASAFGADMIVMGAYGHSRLREWVLGGTTREVLRSMSLPVLMAH